MKEFLRALLPTAFLSLVVGYAIDTPKKEIKPPPAENPPVVTPCENNQETIDRIVGSYQEKYAYPSHVSTYIRQHFCNALAVEETYGIPVAGVLAKSASEHSFGTQGDKIAEGNNHFGIKWKEQYKEKYPECFFAQTWEYTATQREQDCFVRYATSRASYLHFGEFLTTREIGGSKVYTAVLEHKDSARAFLTALAASDYSTNPDEGKLTLGILDKYHLEELSQDIKRELPK